MTSSKWIRCFLLVLGAMVLATGPAHAQKKLTFLTWNHPQNESMFRQWIADFESRHPDVKVEWLDKKGTEWAAFYQTQLVAGTPPDIIDTQAMLWMEYAANNVLLDLTPYLRREPAVREAFIPGMLKYWEVDGKTYALPYYINKTVVYYNKPLLQKAGITKLPQNVDELVDYSYKISALSPETTGYLTLNFDWLYWPIFAASGVEFLAKDGKSAAFNTPKMVALLKKLGKATADGAINKLSWTGRWAENNSAFRSGSVGMYLGHGGAYYNFKNAEWIKPDTIGVSDFPGGWGVLNPHGFSISRATKHPELAWEFLKTITSDKWTPQTAKRLIRTVGNKTADAELDRHLAKEDPVGKAVMQIQAANLDKVTMLKTPLDAKLQDAFWPEIQSALLNQKDPKAALDDAERKVNRILRRGQ